MRQLRRASRPCLPTAPARQVSATASMVRVRPRYRRRRAARRRQLPVMEGNCPASDPCAALPARSPRYITASAGGRLRLASRRELAGGNAGSASARLLPIRAYLEAENSYTASAMADTEDSRRTLFAEMKGRIKEDDARSPPRPAFAYYTTFRRSAARHPIFCRRPRRRR